MRDSKRIEFAEKRDEEDLRTIMLAYGMDLAGEVEEHLVVKVGDSILAGGKVTAYGRQRFFLAVLGVKEEERKKGVGGLLLQRIIQRPWECCADGPVNFNSKIPYSVATIARGEALNFYQKLHFQPCSFEEIPEAYCQQCMNCPEREECQPIPMIYYGG